MYEQAHNEESAGAYILYMRTGDNAENDARRKKTPGQYKRFDKKATKPLTNL
jgi:hypothetical protein